MKKVLLYGTTLAMLLACGGEDKPSIELDLRDSRTPTETADRNPDVCSASCGQKVCGPNGCGGNCGLCEFQLETCTDEGLCEPTPCESTKDCPGNLLCAKDSGKCVVCVGDEDCSEGKTCGADHECHDQYPCQSDLDCKAYGLVCDKDAELCVECLSLVDCESKQHCKDSYCLDDVCVAGESKCEDGQVLACTDGSGWVVEQVCGAAQYCEEAACHDGCEPGVVWCEGDVYKVCADDGKSVQYEEDCAAKDQHCFDGACIPTICVADSTFCVDDDTAAACANDGMSFSEADCPAEHSCSEGSCLAWACTPGMAMCVEEIATFCDSIGLGPVEGGGLDCVQQGQTCKDGECVSCQPLCDGKECGEDGCGGSCGECADGQVCISGQCPPEGQECDDGNDVDWDGCTDGQLSEFRVNAHSISDQRLPTVASLPGQHLLAFWQSKGQFGDNVQPVARTILPGAGPQGSDKNMSDSLDWSSAGPVAAFAGDERVVVTWVSSDQDGDGYGVFARSVHENLTPVGDVVQVNSSWIGDQLDQEIACVDEEGCLVVWTDWVGGPLDASQYVISGQWLHLGGSKKGEEFSLVPAAGVQHPAVACADSEQCVVAWTKEEGDTHERAIWAGHIALDDLAVSGAQQANTVDLGKQEQAAVACDGTGQFLVVWQSSAQDSGGGTGVFGRLLSPELEWVGEQFQVSEPLSGNQGLPQASGSPSGGFLVVWTGSVQSDNTGIAARLLDSDGAPASPGARLNEFTTNHQGFPRVSAMSTGFVVIWESSMTTESGTGIDIMMRRLGPGAVPSYL